MTKSHKKEYTRLIDTRLIQLQKVTAEITADITNLDKASYLIINSLREMFDGSSCAIRLYDEETDTFEPQIANGVFVNLVDRPPRPEGMSRYVLTIKETSYLTGSQIKNPSDGTPSAHEDLVKAKIKAAAYLPLLKGTSILGVLYVVFSREWQFSLDDKLILKLFAQQVSVAIANAHTYIQRIKTFSFAKNRMSIGTLIG